MMQAKHEKKRSIACHLGRIAASAMGVFMVAAVCSGPALADKDRYDVGESVPVFTLKSVNPEEAGDAYVSVDKFFGPEAKTPKKALLLSFFATYCEPCKKEMPFLAALHAAYQDKGLQVLVVSIDKEADKIDELRTLAKSHNVQFPVLSDRFNIVAKRYFISKLPNVYLLNGDGKVGMAAVGYNDDITKKLLEEVRRTIGEPATEPVPESIAKFLNHSAPEPQANAAGVKDDDDGKKNVQKKAKGKGKRRQR